MYIYIYEKYIERERFIYFLILRIYSSCFCLLSFNSSIFTVFCVTVSNFRHGIVADREEWRTEKASDLLNELPRTSTLFSRGPTWIPGTRRKKPTRHSLKLTAKAPEKKCPWKTNKPFLFGFRQLFEKSYVKLSGGGGGGTVFFNGRFEGVFGEMFHRFFPWEKWFGQHEEKPHRVQWDAYMNGWFWWDQWSM